MMSVNAPLRNETFDANRAVGRIALAVDQALGVTRRRRVHEAGSLRVRFPNQDMPGMLDAVIVNTAGGMTGGDRFDIDIEVAAGAALTVTTAAAEKIHRSLAPDTEIAVRLQVGSCGTLAWLPQEMIVFDRVRLKRAIDVDLAPDAHLLLAEAVIFGRSAMGEAVTSGKLLDRWRVRRGGALVFAETVRLDGMVAETLARRAVAAGGVAVASVLKIPGGDDDVTAVRAAAENLRGEVGISAWNGHAVVRLVAPGGEILRHDLMVVLRTLHSRPLPRLWLN
ncbi:MAG: urease accessory protein UreD [Xanthobacteraceae bacterium]